MATLTSRDSTLTPEQVLEQGLCRWFGRPVRIVSFKQDAMDGFSTNPVSRLEVTLDSGAQLPVIFKRFLPKAARDIAQEVRLYQNVLVNGKFDTPALYAAVDDDATNRHWLFLEDVGDWRLEYCETGVWEVAFRWLGRMHAGFYGRVGELKGTAHLPEHDAAFFRALAEFARQTLVQRGSSSALARFERLMREGLEGAIAELECGPRTLVHGDFSCHNIMVQHGGRIRPIDWEWAAIGAPAWDVVRLLDGWGDERDRLLSAYCHAMSNEASTALDIGAFERSIPHCGVMLKLWRIRWWAKACQEPGGVNRILDSIETIWGDPESEVSHV